MSSQVKKSGAKSNPSGRRKMVVLSALAASLTITAAFLRFISPPPVIAETSLSLSAVESPDTIALAINQPATRQWKSIYIHQSKTLDGDDQTLANAGLGDHFVICNGEGGATDGELKIRSRWDKQLPALPPRGVNNIRGDCISICLVGDIDTAKPTAAQFRQLRQLVGSLQSKHRIASNGIFMINQSTTPAGIGKHFPIHDFRQHMAGNQ